MISWASSSQLMPTDGSSHSCHETNRLLRQLYQGLNTTIHLAKLHTTRQNQACRDMFTFSHFTRPKDWQVPSLVLEMHRSHALYQLGLQAWKFSAMHLWVCFWHHGTGRGSLHPSSSNMTCRRASLLVGPYTVWFLKSPAQLYAKWCISHATYQA